MSQRKRVSASQGQNKRRADPLGDDDDDGDATFTQPSSSQAQRGMERLTSSQVDQKTAEVIQFILVKDQKKVPVRRADLVKHVFKEYRNVYSEIMERARLTFDQVFGLKLVEIDTKNHLYILINGLEPSDGATPTQGPASPKTGLLFIILSVIFMKRGAVKESVVWSTLKKLRVDPGERHEQFGDVKKLLTDEFVRQKYLEYVRIPHTEPVEYEFHWGQRAEIEVSKDKILEFMGELHGQDPQTWSQQYREAHAAPAAPSTSQPHASPSQPRPSPSQTRPSTSKQRLSGSQSRLSQR
ncbi:necdin-like 2 [Eucyclogobius newberryi]|uniref:necdin-like 2 n=1 Tax=Eucyclogobius newberryi TaxID=166745 RepID=UPI003B5BEE90